MLNNLEQGILLKILLCYFMTQVQSHFVNKKIISWNMKTIRI